MNIFKEGFMEKIVMGVVLLIIAAVMFILTGKEEKPVMSQVPLDQPTAALPSPSSEIAVLEKNLEEKIAASLEKIKGVGKVKVLVTFNSGLKKEYARDENVTKRTSKETDKEGGVRETVEITENNQLVVPGNSSPVVVMEQRPQVAGVLVIAQGASDPKIKEQLFHAVRILLDIQPSKISVVPMEGV